MVRSRVEVFEMKLVQFVDARLQIAHRPHGRYLPVGLRRHFREYLPRNTPQSQGALTKQSDVYLARLVDQLNRGVLYWKRPYGGQRPEAAVRDQSGEDAVAK